MELYSTKEKEIILLDENREEDIATYLDVTDMTINETSLAGWLSLTKDLEFREVDGIFSFRFDWGVNKLDVPDIVNLVRNFNAFLVENDVDKLTLMKDTNVHIGGDILIDEIQDIIEADKLKGAIKAAGAYTMNLMVS